MVHWKLRIKMTTIHLVLIILEDQKANWEVIIIISTTVKNFKKPGCMIMEQDSICQM